MIINIAMCVDTGSQANCDVYTVSVVHHGFK